MTYHSESAYKHVWRITLIGHDLVDKIGNNADDSDERDELHGTEGRKGHA